MQLIASILCVYFSDVRQATNNSQISSVMVIPLDSRTGRKKVAFSRDLSSHREKVLPAASIGRCRYDIGILYKKLFPLDLEKKCCLVKYTDMSRILYTNNFLESTRSGRNKNIRIEEKTIHGMLVELLVYRLNVIGYLRKTWLLHIFSLFERFIYLCSNKYATFPGVYYAV